MSNVFESPDLFEASIKLEDAAVELSRLTRGEEIGPEGKEVLQWVSQLLARVDWTSANWATEHVSPDIAMKATSVRPTYYAALQAIRSEFADTKEMMAFSEGLPTLLITTLPKKSEYLELAAKFLHVISRNLFLEIGGNLIQDVPQEFVLMV